MGLRMTKLLADWKALPLDEQHKLFPQLNEIYEAAKEARRQTLEAEIRQLGFKPGTSKPRAKVKYRGVNGETWSGTGQMAGWLKKAKEAGEDIETYRVEGQRALDARPASNPTSPASPALKLSVKA
jgi:DNA-binding protein H-NS